MSKTVPPIRDSSKVKGRRIHQAQIRTIPIKNRCSERGGHKQLAQQWARARAGASTSKIRILGSELGKFIISRETRNICTTPIQRVSLVHRRLKINDSSMIPKYKER